MSVNVFAYGSNMSLRRMRERVPDAEVVTTGYVEARTLCFHKRGADDSAKADAFLSGQSSDRVWGVVYSISPVGKSILDGFEFGYSVEETEVATAEGRVSAAIYIAYPETIDSTLKPFSWYHHLVMHGAREHSLPTEYQQKLRFFDSVKDHDEHRAEKHLKLILGTASISR